MASTHSFGQLTPEQRADPSTGEIPNPSPINQEYYLGPIGVPDSQTGGIVGAVSPNDASLTWYKFTSDGVTPILFDMYGTNMAFSLGGFGARNGGELAVYNSVGQYIAGNQGSGVPASGDSNIPPTSAPTSAVTYRQPINPTLAVNANDPSTGFRNDQNLANLAFVKNPESNPRWASTSPTNPDETSLRNWNQFPMLPAGEYFLAVTGFSTYFSGFSSDATTIDLDTENNRYYTNNHEINSTTPFGWLSFHAFSGTYQINARRAGDMDLNATINANDLRLLRLQAAYFKPSLGIATAGFLNGDPQQQWVGLPNQPGNASADLQRYDLTGNQRIDKFDIAAWGRYTDLPTNTALTWNKSPTPGGDPLNPAGPGDGMTWEVLGGQNFNDANGAQVFLDGDTVTFNDANNGNYSVAIPQAVSPAQVTVNTIGTYSFSGPAGLAGTGGITKSGTGTLILSSASSTYTGATTVQAGRVVLAGADAQNAVFGAGRGGADVQGGKLVFDYTGIADPVADIRTILAAGFALPARFSSGAIRSSTVSNIIGLGYLDNTASQQVIVARTYYGDANLDGAVTTGDFTALAINFNANGMAWAQGDFNYDGKVNALDFNALSANFGATPLAGDLLPLGTLVPEPVTILHLVAAGLASMRARRR